ncbi:MAG: cation diffusion facilitator family transporter [Actinomycetota bacterium]|nr:cation diffusion facilitator family transporter [Actinomycetota bacterium]
MSSQGGSKAVIAALVANLGIAVLKFIAFFITRSSSLLAEGVHSLVDSANQVLLLIGGRRARRDADAQHQFGYGRDRYIYGFLVALVIFTAGGLFALYEGIQKLQHPHHIDSALVAIVVLLGAIGLESFSLRTAVQESRPVKGQQSWFTFIRTAKVPELPVVLLEDTAALIGLVLALLGVGLTVVTDDPIWDAVGTTSIGVLLIAVAAVLVVETKSLLLGESAAPDVQQKVADHLLGGGVDRVIHLRTLYISPEDLLVAAKVALPAASTLAEVASAIDAAEARVRAAVPEAGLIYLEPDVDRGVQPATPAIR